MAGIVMKKGFTEKARKKAFESIFKKFDHNHNGKNICIHYQKINLSQVVEKCVT